jgi:hypothetical protein
MKFVTLSPNQIITLNDFPLHNIQVLKIYYYIYRKGCGRIIPPCPVIHKNLVRHIFNKSLKLKLEKFEKKNSRAEYFLLDGSHKTTAACLTKNKIKVMVFKNDKDITKAKRLAKTGELFSLTVGKTIKDNVDILNKHFKEKPYFETVEEKTERMIRKKSIPSYMNI